MRAEPSKLTRHVIAYYQKFGRHVPESAMRFLAAEDLVAHLQDALANGVPLSESGWGWASPLRYSPRGCIVRDESPESETPTKGPDGESVQ